MTSPFGAAVIIANVRSGKGGVGAALPEVEAAMRDRGLEYEIRRTEYRGHAIEIAREVVTAGGRFVVAMGGDGTVHEVVNGMLADDKPVNPEAVLGVVAAGTGSDFIKTFGMPSTPKDAVRHLDGGESFLIDIGKVTYMQDGVEVTRYFPNIAEVGLGAACVARAEKLPRWLGPTVYLVAFWLTMRKHKAAHVKVDVVDRVYEGLMNNMVVANGQFFGGGMKIAPKAAPTDGLLDIQVEHARKKDAIAMMPKVFKGQHVPHPDIEEYKRVRCSITSETPLPIEADGEVLGTTPASFEVIPEAIQLKV
jgi:YegS/Rv2252/BmrU family lipid kinase